MARAIALAVGMLILAAVAHVTIQSTGGYGSAHAWVTIGVAAGVAAGSVFSGMAWSDKRHALAVLLVLAIVAGEAYGFIATAERLIVAREATQAPLRQLAEDRVRTQSALDAAKAALEGVPTSTPRLERALRDKAATDAVRGAANNQRLAVGTANQILVSDGTDPAWGTVAASDTLAGFIEIGVQSEMEAASSNTRAVTPGRQHFHPGHPKAGGNLNGSGTPAFRSGDVGMGAVTDNGTGDYVVAFDTAFADTNYWCTGYARCTDTVGSVQTGVMSSGSDGAKTTSTFQVKGFSVGGGSAGANQDNTEIGMMFWGDYA